jgi:starch-binding outer membrane protein, SusD/RagB family
MKRLLKDSKKIAAVLITICLLSACDNWLDVKPEKDLIRQDFWKTKEDANSALTGIYSAFRDGSGQNFLWGEVRADIIKGLPGDFGSIAFSNITPTNYVVSWAPYYTTINLANTLLYYDKEIFENDKSFTLEMKNAVEAEALFLRSFSYFYLVRLWKGVPLVLNPSISDTCNIYPPNAKIDPNTNTLKWRDNEPEIINLIKSDLLIAKDHAYTNEFQSDNRSFRGRANKYSIMTLLADVYLWNQEYQKCIDYCDSVINTNIYSLVQGDANALFTVYFPGNSKESIFELQFTDDGSEDQVNPFFKNFWFSATNFSKLINLQNGSYQFTFNTYYLSNLFPDQIDNRSFSAMGQKSVWKYIGYDYNDNSDRRSNSSQRDAHIIYYKYSDVLLMKAEALNESNRTNEAQDYVLQTAGRAGLPSDAVTIDPLLDKSAYEQMRDFILDERGREFALEGKRWFDLLRDAKRNNFQNKKDLGEKLINLAPEQSRDILNSKINDTLFYYLPVPYDEIKRNKNLRQNPFYER